MNDGESFYFPSLSFWFLTLFKETFFLVIRKNVEALLMMTTSRVFSFCASRAREDGDR